MIASPLVSILVPAFNAADFLPAAVRSVQEQSIGNWELLIVDDGSTDDTLAVARQVAAEDRRIRVVSQPNAGQGAARNRALRAARGEWIAMLDADDVWLPTKLEVQLGAASQSLADVVFSNAFIRDAGAPGTDGSFEALVGRYSGETMFELLISAARMPILTVMVSRKAIEAVGGFDESRALQGCEDYDLYCRLARHGCTFLGMGDKLAIYRRHPAQTTHRRSSTLAATLAVVEKHWGGQLSSNQVALRRWTDLRREILHEALERGDVPAAHGQLRLILKADPFRPGLYLQYLLLSLRPSLYLSWARRRGSWIVSEGGAERRAR